MVQCHKPTIKEMEKPNRMCNIHYIKCFPRCNVTNQKFKNQTKYVNYQKQIIKQPKKRIIERRNNHALTPTLA